MELDQPRAAPGAHLPAEPPDDGRRIRTAGGAEENAVRRARRLLRLVGERRRRDSSPPPPPAAASGSSAEGPYRRAPRRSRPTTSGPMPSPGRATTVFIALPRSSVGVRTRAVSGRQRRSLGTSSSSSPSAEKMCWHGHLGPGRSYSASPRRRDGQAPWPRRRVGRPVPARSGRCAGSHRAAAPAIAHEQAAALDGHEVAERRDAALQRHDRATISRRPSPTCRPVARRAAGQAAALRC